MGFFARIIYVLDPYIVALPTTSNRLPLARTFPTLLRTPVVTARDQVNTGKRRTRTCQHGPNHPYSHENPKQQQHNLGSVFHVTPPLLATLNDKVSGKDLIIFFTALLSKHFLNNFSKTVYSLISIAIYEECWGSPYRIGQPIFDIVFDLSSSGWIRHTQFKL